MRDAFISYSTTDSTEAYSVRNYLQRCGCTCWMAPDDISAGSDYAEAIPKAIADCCTFVLILSPNAQNSNWVRKELGKALDKGKTVIPFMIRDFKLNDTYDFLLENAQWCYAYKNRDEALQKMLVTVKAKQGTYRYTSSSATTTPKQTVSAPKQTTSAPKATVTAPKTTVTQSKPRPAAKKYGNSKAISRFIYSLVTWGTFCSVTGLLIGLSSLLSEHTAMGPGAYFIVGIGMLAAIIMLRVAHQKDWIDDAIRAVKRGNIIQRFLLWLVQSVGILVVLVIIGGLTYLRIVSQKAFTQDQLAILVAVSGALSLAVVIGWLKRYDY